MIATLGMKPGDGEMEKVWVFFADKDLSSYDPYEYLDPLAVERRQLEEIPVWQASDAPVTEAYIREVVAICGNNRAVSRWFNAMCCLANEEQIQQLRKLSFVKAVKVVNKPTNLEVQAAHALTSNKEDFSLTEDKIAFIEAQLMRMQGAEFAKYRIDGSGVRVAIFDVGFKSYRTNPAFEEIRNDNRIFKTYDFVKKKDEVDVGGSHGTSVMSCVGGKINGHNIGLATGATFLLARTETWTELYSEEENWLAAAEWADRHGAHVINSSLGYTYHRYFREEMDGHHSLVARAANMAASKGILVVNSAGNEGDGSWKVIGTPADADSVLSIGGIDPQTGVHTSFSSFGPSRDKRLKPNVTAYGHVMATSPSGISETQGTSFSGPLVAGFAACVRQARPAYKNMQVFREIEQSGELYPYFDYAHGYGVPQANFFFKMQVKKAPTFSFAVHDELVNIQVNQGGTGLLEQEMGELMWKERYIKAPNYVFYHIENKKGYLDKYFVVAPIGNKEILNQLQQQGIDTTDEESWLDYSIKINKSEYQKPYIIRAYYKGYVGEIEMR